MGIFGRSKKKKQQQALLKAQQEREAAEALERKRAAEAFRQRQAELEAEEEKKEEEPASPTVEKDQSLNETIDTADEEPQDQSLEEPQPKEISIGIHDATGAFPSASDARGPLAQEPMEPADLPTVQEEGDADEQQKHPQSQATSSPVEDAAWTPFEEDPFAAATYEKWQFEESEPEDAAPEVPPPQEEERAPEEEEPAPEEEEQELGAVPSTDDIMNDLELADEAINATPLEGEGAEVPTEENKDETDVQPPIAEAEEATTSSETVQRSFFCIPFVQGKTDKVTTVEGDAADAHATAEVAADAITEAAPPADAATDVAAPQEEEKKEEEKPKEPPFDSEKAFNRARELVDEAAVTITLAASAAYSMATVCVGDIQAGFAEEINDQISVDTRSTKDANTVNDDNTLDGTIDSRGNYTEYTDDDGSYSRTSRSTYDDASRYSRGSRGTYDDASKYSRGSRGTSTYDDRSRHSRDDATQESGAAADDESPSSRYRRYDDTRHRDDVSRDGSRTSRVTFQEPQDVPKPLPTVKSQDVNDVDSSMGTVLASNTAAAAAASSSLGDSPVEEESLDDVLNGSNSDVGTPPRGPQGGDEEDNEDGEYFPLEDLQAKTVPGIDETCREIYLSPQDFRACFNMSKSEFAAMPKWKRDSAKKRVSLF